MRNVLGIVSQGHDASVALINNSEILFAGHAERYSRKKNDGDVNRELLADCFQYGTPESVVFYERPLYKRARQLLAGQWTEALFAPTLKSHLRSLGLQHLPVQTVSHHKSHAAAGFYTSGYQDAAVVVVDAIGEFDTVSVWHGSNNTLRKIWSQQYPNSLGLLYSAFTHRIGLKPNEEEYILMGMSALGDPARFSNAIHREFLDDDNFPRVYLNHNVHRGISWWEENELTEKDFPDVAAGIQHVVEQYMVSLIQSVSRLELSKNLVLMGGVALNCVANSKIADSGAFENIWIMPNPGDAGSSIGAAASVACHPLNWSTPYLGHNIDRELNIPAAIDALLNGKVIAVANGRAEFGPRSLGNRSILADPRGKEVKDRVNSIKKREMFRPFAPAILEEYAHNFFELPVSTSPYMQFVALCKFPELFPAICHYDNTSRVQTVTKSSGSKFHELLLAWYHTTGCPMLLNTSLNIKGEPLVNTWEDAIRFQHVHNIPVF